MRSSIITVCLMSLVFVGAATASPERGQDGRDPGRHERGHDRGGKLEGRGGRFGRDGGHGGRFAKGLRLKRVSPEVKQAAAAVKADLQAIVSGGYITREDLKPLFEAARAAMSDREVTDEEKAALKAMADEVAAKIPAELSAQLKADVATLKELIGQPRD
jgi:hypothetical protein